MLATDRKQDTSEAILDAVDRLIGRLGFRKMTMDDVAREAGVSKRTIYVYFQSKEDVGLSSIARVVDGAFAAIFGISQRNSPPAARLKEILIERVMYRIRQVQEYHHGLDEIFEAIRPAYMGRRQEFFAREAELIARVIQEGVDSGSFFCSDPAVVAHDLILATNAFLPYSLSVKQLGNPTDIQRDLSRMANLLVRGLQLDPRGTL